MEVHMTPHTHPACITYMPTCPACIAANPDRVAQNERDLRAADDEYQRQRRERRREAKRRQRAALVAARPPDWKKKTFNIRHEARLRREARKARKLAMEVAREAIRTAHDPTRWPIQKACYPCGETTGWWVTKTGARCARCAGKMDNKERHAPTGGR